MNTWTILQVSNGGTKSLQNTKPIRNPFSQLMPIINLVQKKGLAKRIFWPLNASVKDDEFCYVCTITFPQLSWSLYSLSFYHNYHNYITPCLSNSTISKSVTSCQTWQLLANLLMDLIDLNFSMIPLRNTLNEKIICEGLFAFGN